jgi:hypothetical protein
MKIKDTNKIIQLFVLLFLLGCKENLNEEDKIFHACTQSEMGGIFFGLYKNHKCEFCEGDFLDPGCYTVEYILSGDTIKLNGIKKESALKYSRLKIFRYSEQDSSYWLQKYPKFNDWRSMRWSDSAKGSTGDVFQLDNHNNPIFDKNQTNFIIRFDTIKDNYR